MENENKNKPAPDRAEGRSSSRYLCQSCYHHSFYFRVYCRLCSYYAGIAEGWCAVTYRYDSGTCKTSDVALQDNVDKYEQNFGPIRMPEEQQQNAGSKTFVPPLSDFKGEA